MESGGKFTARCHRSTVREAMSIPAVTVAEEAGFQQIIRAFRTHTWRAMPVVDDAGRLQGLLLRKDFLGVHHLPALPGEKLS